MRKPRLFTDQPLTPGDQVVLEGTVARHLGNVLRARAGEQIALFNGDGREFAAKVLSVSKREVIVDIGAAAAPQTESPVHTTLGLCLSKGDRFDWAIQKATELGVGAVAPLHSERVEFSIPQDRMKKRITHWQQIAISACEQCGLNRPPAVDGVLPLNTFMDQAQGLKLIAHPGEGPLDAGAVRDATDIALLTGPEGGFSDDELAAARAAGFVGFALGERVLRAETAPVA